VRTGTGEILIVQEAFVNYGLLQGTRELRLAPSWRRGVG